MEAMRARILEQALTAHDAKRTRVEDLRHFESRMSGLMQSATEKEAVNVALRVAVTRATQSADDARSVAPALPSIELAKMNEQFQAQTAALQSSQRLVDQLSHQVAMLNQAVSQLMNNSATPVAVVSDTGAVHPVISTPVTVAALVPEIVLQAMPQAKTSAWS